VAVAVVVVVVVTGAGAVVSALPVKGSPSGAALGLWLSARHILACSGLYGHGTFVILQLCPLTRDSSPLVLRLSFIFAIPRQCICSPDRHTGMMTMGKSLATRLHVSSSGCAATPAHG
jgi:hypothetical protein